MNSSAVHVWQPFISTKETIRGWTTGGRESGHVAVSSAESVQITYMGQSTASSTTGRDCRCVRTGTMNNRSRINWVWCCMAAATIGTAAGPMKQVAGTGVAASQQTQNPGGQQTALKKCSH